MKKSQKFFSIICASLLCMLPCTGRCRAAGRVSVNLASSHRIVRLLDNKNLVERIKEINRHLTKGYTVEILDGGSYYNTLRANEFECHHLVSSHFCKNHPDVLSRSRAPSVVIPKELHRLTGSHPCSGFMDDYLKREEEVFAKRNSIHDVVKLGMRDLIRAIKLYYRLKSAGQIYVKSREVVLQTPVKRAFEQVQILSPLKPPLKPEKFFSPTKNADSSKQVDKKEETPIICPRAPSGCLTPKKQTSSSRPTDEEDAPMVCPSTPLKSRKFRSRLSVTNTTPITSSSSSNG